MLNPILTTRRSGNTSFADFRCSKISISKLQNSHKLTVSEVLVLRMKFPMSQIPPGVPSGALGSPSELNCGKRRIPRHLGPWGTQGLGSFSLILIDF